MDLYYGKHIGIALARRYLAMNTYTYIVHPSGWLLCVGLTRASSDFGRPLKGMNLHCENGPGDTEMGREFKD